MNLTKKAALYGAATLAALGLAGGQMAMAEPAVGQTGTFGSSGVATDPNGVPVWQLNGTLPGGGALFFNLPAGVAPSDLTNLTFTYAYFGGSGVTTDNNTYIDYFDSSPNPPPNDYAVQKWAPSGQTATSGTTVNFTGGVIAASIYDHNYAQDGQNGLVNWSTFTTQANTGKTSYIPVAQIALINITNTGAAQDLDIYSYTYSYNDKTGTNHTISATLAPEPSSVAAFAFIGLGAMGLILKAKKRKALDA